ncbi:MAG: toll/interleukin-1 receptor domain-containing protein [Thiolinea sp.]
MQYDIFISYRSTQRDWAEALAHNLQSQDYKVFFDVWELRGGQNFTQAEQALRHSRCAVLIATPEAAESG